MNIGIFINMSISIPAKRSVHGNTTFVRHHPGEGPCLYGETLSSVNICCWQFSVLKEFSYCYQGNIVPS